MFIFHNKLFDKKKENTIWTLRFFTFAFCSLTDFHAGDGKIIKRRQKEL